MGVKNVKSNIMLLKNIQAYTKTFGITIPMINLILALDFTLNLNITLLFTKILFFYYLFIVCFFLYIFTFIKK